MPLLQESTTLEVWPLQQTKLQEVTFTGWVPEPLRSRQQRGFVLRRRREQPDSPRAVTELPGSIGDLTEQYSDGDMELVLALESTLDHQTWTRESSPRGDAADVAHRRTRAPAPCTAWVALCI